MKIGLICGGPWLERGISLNSARSCLDHLESGEIEIEPFYINLKKQAYKISKSQLYSNTPSDFDFKLLKETSPLSESGLARELKKLDIAFPVIHGPYGEDGEIQAFLEKNRIPFVGSGSVACKRAFDKFEANTFIMLNGFFAMPSALLRIYYDDHRKIVEDFFEKYKIKRAIVKPASGGSSIGVFSVSSWEEALQKANLLFSKRMDTRVVVEPFVEGIEFTMIILQNRFGLPVALPPTEIETDYTRHQIFDFRRKYLPTRQVAWHCPPRFGSQTIEKIQAQGEQIFKLFDLSDYGRFDGWILPDGNIWFCDFNTVSGMEQNSFLFQQGSRVGMSHSDMLRHVIKSACLRQGVEFPSARKKPDALPSRKRVNVLFGGLTSERQVSLMSGTNVWLKLRGSKKYKPQPYLWDTKGRVWKLPYHLALNHTVEEIENNCENYLAAKEKLEEFENRARVRLGMQMEKNKQEFFEPVRMSLDDLIADSEFLFLGLHGGKGEDGTLQKRLEEKGLKYNGSDSTISRLCMNKWATSVSVKNFKIKGVDSIPGILMRLDQLLSLDENRAKIFWKSLQNNLGGKTFVIKPSNDGCSSGVVRLYNSEELMVYIRLLKSGETQVPKRTFRGHHDFIEMPAKTPEHFILEKYIKTDLLRVKGLKLKHARDAGWIEVTCGAVEECGKIKALNPSITVAEGEILTVEEKFQGGTGVNITPLPEDIISRNNLEKIRRGIRMLAEKIGIRGYSRIDAFVNINSGEVLIIEINTLPALTPSTVLFHQALSEKPPISPRELIEKLIENKGY